jgi:hypothetical protein
MDGNEAPVDQAGQKGESAAAAPAGGGVPMKQRKNRGNMRKRDADSIVAAATADEDTTTVVRKAKQARGEPLAFSTKQDKKQELAVTYAGTAEAIAAKDESATRHLETETQFDRDAR